MDLEKRISDLEKIIESMDKMAHDDGYAEKLSDLVKAEEDEDAECMIPLCMDGTVIWAIGVYKGFRILYMSDGFGKPFEVAGDSEGGIPADAPKAVAEVFWTGKQIAPLLPAQSGPSF